eukprot:snap_masked-scaffold_2-processed-gene-22.33-mRNA-1 protein AED:1.00 eAED:1.00 QI:0/-1/0/0/-1/1/1/0/88
MIQTLGESSAESQNETFPSENMEVSSNGGEICASSDTSTQNISAEQSEEDIFLNVKNCTLVRRELKKREDYWVLQCKPRDKVMPFTLS